MYSLVLNGEPINVSIVLLITKCHLFQTKPELLGKPYTVESRVSSDSLLMFVGAIDGAVPEISDANVRDLLQLCDEFKFIELGKAVGDWQVKHTQINPVIRRELYLVRAALEERLESQGRMMLMLDQALHRQREAAISKAEKLSTMEAEVSGLRSLLGETAVSVQKAARDIDQVRAAAAEQRMAHGRDICAFEEEMVTVGKAIEEAGRLLGKQEGEWKAAIGDLHKKAAQEGSDVSGLKDVLGRLENKHEKRRQTVAGQGDELAETRRRNSELGALVQRLEEEYRLLRELGEILNGQRAQVEAGQ
jgi:chromosome segregation ATPase